MPLSDADFISILEDKSKIIVGDIEWLEDEDHSPAVEFRAEVKSEKGWPLFIKGSYNYLALTLTYALILQSDGRIYGLDLGKGHINQSPQRIQIGEKHKHRWTEQFRDKVAYVPEDITAPVSDPLAVWCQFCAESNIEHDGEMKPLPSKQQELFL